MKPKHILLMAVTSTLCTIPLSSSHKEPTKAFIINSQDITKHTIEAEKHTAPLEGIIADVRSTVVSLKNKLAKFMAWKKESKKDLKRTDLEQGKESKKYKHQKTIHNKIKTAKKSVSKKIKTLERKMAQYQQEAQQALDDARDIKEEIKKLKLQNAYTPKHTKKVTYQKKEDIARKFQKKMEQKKHTHDNAKE